MGAFCSLQRCSLQFDVYKKWSRNKYNRVNKDTLVNILSDNMRK